MCGATFFALFIGNLSSILINVDVAQKKYAEVLNQVCYYTEQALLPLQMLLDMTVLKETRYHGSWISLIRCQSTCDSNKSPKSFRIVSYCIMNTGIAVTFSMKPIFCKVFPMFCVKSCKCSIADVWLKKYHYFTVYQQQLFKTLLGDYSSRQIDLNLI